MVVLCSINVWAVVVVHRVKRTSRTTETSDSNFGRNASTSQGEQEQLHFFIETLIQRG